MKTLATGLAALVVAIGARAEPGAVDTLPRYAETHLNFVVVGVADMQRALAFYREVIGMHERGRAQPDLRNYEVIVGFDNLALSPGISLKYRDGPPTPRGNGSSALNVVVTGLAARVARVVALGGEVTTAYARHDSPAMDYGYATIKDPDGNAIELVEYFRRPDPRRIEKLDPDDASTTVAPDPTR